MYDRVTMWNTIVTSTTKGGGGGGGGGVVRGERQIVNADSMVRGRRSEVRGRYIVVGERQIWPVVRGRGRW